MLPSVSGLSIERLDAWWSSHKEGVTALLSSFALEVVTPGSIVVSWRGRGGVVCMYVCRHSRRGCSAMAVSSGQ